MFCRSLGILAFFAIGLNTLQASAADMPLKALTSPTPAYSWTGFYVGGFVGAGWGTAEATLTSIVVPGAPPQATNFPGAQVSKSGFVGGGQVGYNYQTGWIVLGVEGDVAGMGTKGTAPCLVIFSCTASDSWLATVSGRVGGVVADRTLVFIKGGGAWLNSTYTGTVPVLLGGVGLSQSVSATSGGWLLGMGVEYAFTSNWSGVIEYNYMDFGTKNVAFRSFPGGFLPAGSTANFGIANKLSVARAGVNYKF